VLKLLKSISMQDIYSLSSEFVLKWTNILQVTLPEWGRMRTMSLEQTLCCLVTVSYWIPEFHALWRTSQRSKRGETIGRLWMLSFDSWRYRNNDDDDNNDKYVVAVSFWSIYMYSMKAMTALKLSYVALAMRYEINP